MYLESFGLKKKPFSLTSDPSMLYLTDSHREALAVLCYGLLQRKGLMVMLGHAGTGKTSLVARAVVGLPPSRVQFAFILNPTFTSAEFMETVLLGFGNREIPATKPQRLARLEKHLLQIQADGKIAALIVDEAHKLNVDALEEVRLLGNLERRSEKLLQIILAGQNELGATLNREDCVQLKQRVSLRVALRPLAPAEVGQYIACRWARAGGKERAPFSPQAVDLTAHVSQGIPRTINVICDNALILAFGDKSRTVEAAHVSQSCRDLDLLEVFAESYDDGDFALSPAADGSHLRVADLPKRSPRVKAGMAGR
jgi:general secretion pathway protein A